MKSNKDTITAYDLFRLSMMYFELSIKLSKNQVWEEIREGKENELKSLEKQTKILCNLFGIEPPHPMIIVLKRFFNNKNAQEYIKIYREMMKIRRYRNDIPGGINVVLFIQRAFETMFEIMREFYKLNKIFDGVLAGNHGFFYIDSIAYKLEEDPTEVVNTFKELIRVIIDPEKRSFPRKEIESKYNIEFML